MKLGLLALALLLGCAPAWAQTVIINPPTATLDFVSADHTTIIPVGTAGAGGPLLTGYQGMIFTALTDVTGSVPFLGPGPVVPKSAVTVGSSGPYELSLVQLGLTAIPPCTVVAPALCQAYVVVLTAIGPSGTSPRSVGSSSNPFSLAPLLPTPLPAAPSVLKVKP